MANITRSQARKLLGKHVYAVRKDGSVASGKLVRISGDKLILEQPRGKKARTNAILPLVLFDLLALGTVAGGGWGGGWGGGGWGGGFGGGLGGGWGGGWW
ncbi:hypothetical protein B0G52_108197 [Cohnella sp. SGD-V74]|uniref:50S ribosomal protein L33 n=1 Tax=unclassified Cohnella TaxID=2636738 RepID=UPI000B8BD754|nr:MULTISPECIES: 50S ribosomal protein L33 [unclassified Cohnella]PRX71702.1 hypothetical protein B0G52_108197 [Cohnella sp. SGD-V74]